MARRTQHFLNVMPGVVRFLPALHEHRDHTRVRVRPPRMRRIRLVKYDQTHRVRGTQSVGWREAYEENQHPNACHASALPTARSLQCFTSSQQRAHFLRHERPSACRDPSPAWLLGHLRPWVVERLQLNQDMGTGVASRGAETLLRPEPSTNSLKSSGASMLHTCRNSQSRSTARCGALRQTVGRLEDVVLVAHDPRKASHVARHHVSRA